MALGTATVDFGSTPSQEAQVSVTTSGLTPTSHIEPWVQRQSSADNSAVAHEMLAQFCEFIPEYVTATAFTIYARITGALAAGTFTIHWGHN